MTAYAQTPVPENPLAKKKKRRGKAGDNTRDKIYFSSF
jgi:hypothetical protein